jgi:hypothetical protein
MAVTSTISTSRHPSEAQCVSMTGEQAVIDPGKRARSWRRTGGLLAGLALAVAAVQFTGTAEAGPLDPTQPDNRVIQHDKLPRGAVKATQPRLPAGSQGKTFQRSGVTTNIVGGTAASAADYPWIVGIRTYFLGEDESGATVLYMMTCTGTVVSSTKVLTAAHCATGMRGAYTDVIAGRSNLDGGDGYVARVSGIWTDQSYNAEDLNTGRTTIPVHDVSVLTLKSALPSAYTPVTLSAQGDSKPYTNGTVAKIVGYGITSNGSTATGRLYAASVTIRNNSTCSKALGGFDATTMVCAGTPNGGVDSCHGDSGGPLLVNGVQAGITDWGVDPCGSTYGVYERLSYYASAVQSDLSRKPPVNLDWSGDGHSDLLARDDSNGDLCAYYGSGLADDGFNGFAGSRVLDDGAWEGYTKLFRVTNWNDDGLPSIMAMDGHGLLWQYRGSGQDGFSARENLGNGWTMFKDVFVVNNWNGDGHPNLIGRTSGGDLYLYTSDGKGGWLNNGNGIVIDNGWNIYDLVITPGDWDGAGTQALIGRTPAGQLYLYHGDGRGGFANNGVGTRIGTGWNMFNQFLSPGDWNGDNLIDVIGKTPGGDLRLYKTDGKGTWLNPQGDVIGTDWSEYTVF